MNINVRPDLLKEQYDRAILISDFLQLETSNIDAGRDLIITTNWLLWQKLIKDNHACVHLDYGLVLSPISGLTEEIFIKSNDWLFQNEDDPTHFHGVSLGRKMLKEISVVIAEFERIHGALKALVNAYKVREIKFIGLRTTQDFLDVQDRISIVRQVAKEADCTLEIDSEMSGHTELSSMDYKYAEKRGVGVKAPRKRLSAKIFDACCQLHWRLFRHFKKNKSSILMMHSQLTSIPLLSAADSSTFKPMMLASWYPEKRNLTRLISRLLSGMTLISEKRFEIHGPDQQRIDEILKATRKLVSKGSTPRDIFLFAYIREKMLTRRFLETLAKDVLYAKWVIETYQPQGISTDGMQNTFIQNFLEIAKQQGITTISTWHAPLIHYYKLEIFGCDPRIPRLVDTVLTWGVADEGWLKATGSQSAYQRTGHILASHLLDIKSAQVNVPSAAKTALVLQYTPQYDDFETLSSSEYEFFVRVMASLKSAGFEDIVFKLHPGHNKVDYYESIAETFGFNCKIIARGPFKEYVKWADVVIGPAFSGTMLEVIAAGKIQLPVLLPPHPIDMSVFKNGTVYENLDEVETVLHSRDFPDQSGILKDFCSLDAYENPAGNAWSLIEEFCADGTTSTTKQTTPESATGH